MPTPYYIVLAIIIALQILVNLRIKSRAAEYKRGYDDGFTAHVLLNRKKEAALAPTPTAKNPVVRHVVARRAEQAVCASAE